ncbi:MAG: hypothetical protein ACPKQO_07550 [Nitrososphaeraceae archaeon]
MLNFRFTIFISIISAILFISTLSIDTIVNNAYSENQKLVNNSYNNNTKNIDDIQLTNFNFEQKLNKILSGGMNVLITDTINKLKPALSNTSIDTTSVNNLANISSTSHSNTMNSTKIPFISPDNKTTITSLEIDLASKKDTSLLSTFNFDSLKLFSTNKIINDIYSELGKEPNRNFLNTTNS